MQQLSTCPIIVVVIAWQCPTLISAPQPKSYRNNSSLRGKTRYWFEYSHNCASMDNTCTRNNSDFALQQSFTLSYRNTGERSLSLFLSLSWTGSDAAVCYLLYHLMLYPRNRILCQHRRHSSLVYRLEWWNIVLYHKINIFASNNFLIIKCLTLLILHGKECQSYPWLTSETEKTTLPIIAVRWKLFFNQLFIDIVYQFFRVSMFSISPSFLLNMMEIPQYNSSLKFTHARRVHVVIYSHFNWK